jgi:hypothetical protein
MMKAGIGAGKHSGKAAGVQIQTSLYGSAVPLLYGRTKIPPKLIWVSNFQATNAGGKKGAAKKGAAGGGYDYTCACDFLLAHGPLRDLLNIWRNKDIFETFVTTYRAAVADSGLGYGQINFSSQIPGGCILMAVLGATIEDTLGNFGYPDGLALDDYGGDGELIIGPSTVMKGIPLWNEDYYPPDAAMATPPGITRRPYTYEWNAGASALAVFPSALVGKYVTLTIAWQDPNHQPSGKLNMEFEPYLGSASTPGRQPPYNQTGSQSGQPTVYPWCSGVASAKFDMGQSANFPTLAFESTGLMALWPNGDCDPADIIADLISSGIGYTVETAGGVTAGSAIVITHGLNCSARSVTGAPPMLGALVDSASLAQVSAYCRANGARPAQRSLRHCQLRARVQRQRAEVCAAR